jgi:ubiquinone/menaquinone biosynthesis C-methylase UbiE
LPQGKFYQRDLCDTGLADGSFDLALSIQTMEHMDHPRRAFDEMWRLMKPAARLVVTIPNGKIDDWEGHRNFWTSESFIQMAGKSPIHLHSINDNRNLLFLFQKPAN